MKKSIYAFMLGGFALTMTIIACSSPAKKVENAQENLIEANQELNIAQKDSAADFESFKAESQARIDENEKMIKAYRERMATAKNSTKANDQKVIDILEQRNINMRKKIEEYKENGKDQWVSFKQEFIHDMDELGDALKNLAVNNTK